MSSPPPTGSSSASGPKAPTARPTCCSRSTSAGSKKRCAPASPSRSSRSCSTRSWRRDTAIPRATGTRVSMRARIVYASKERVKQTALNYEDLASPAWKGKICIRSGQHYYNTALFAAYIVKHGEAQDRGMAARAEGQSGAAAVRRRPRDRPRRRGRQVRSRHRQHLLLRADAAHQSRRRSRGRTPPASSCRPSRAAAPT